MIVADPARVQSSMNSVPHRLNPGGISYGRVRLDANVVPVKKRCLKLQMLEGS